MTGTSAIAGLHQGSRQFIHGGIVRGKPGAWRMRQITGCMA